MCNSSALRDLDKVILHCSATIEGAHIDVDTIRTWHKARGWNDIGYHYVIYRDGSVHQGRGVDKIGAHTASQNKTSIGVCYVGGISAKTGKPADTMTAEQEMGWLELWHSLNVCFGKLELYGHNDFARKACPCFDVKEKYKFLIEEK